MITQKFEWRVWRNIYDQINILGSQLKDSLPSSCGRPAKIKISLEETNKIENEIKQLTRNCSAYLDSCKVYPLKPYWYYDRNNEETWASSKEFKYKTSMYKRHHMHVPYCLDN